jgi:hypothetical protein
MRRSLKGWLKARTLNDQAAMGKVKAKVPASVFAKTLALTRDWPTEQRLAIQLHGLLSEFMDSSRLPYPDITKDPNAAAKLATVAVSGKLPAESSQPQAQGGFAAFFTWPVAAIVGMVLFTVLSKISSDADVLKHREEEISKREGVTGFSSELLKYSLIAVGVWVVWDKFGLKEAAAKARRKAGS